MRAEKTYENGALTVKLFGELDHHGAAQIREEVDKELESRAIKKLIWDFENVPFMDSSGIGVIVGRYKKLDAMGGETVIVRLCPQVDKILEISGIKKIIRCEGDREDE